MRAADVEVRTRGVRVCSRKTKLYGVNGGAPRVCADHKEGEAYNSD